MKIQALSTILFLYLGICNFNRSAAYEVVREYHHNVVLVHSLEGCQYNTNNGTAHTHFVPAKKLSRHRKRQLLNRQPLARPFITIFECNVGTERHCQLLKDAVEYANVLFGSAFDFYQPVIVKYKLTDDKDASYIACTSLPITYSLKDPSENMVLSYPVSLVKQFKTNREIVFNQRDDFDIFSQFHINFLREDHHIESTVVHELLHGLGFSSQIREIKKGDLGDNIPKVGNDYFIPDFIRLDYQHNGKVIDGFQPIGIFERNFVEFNKSDHYYFTQSFNSISDLRDLNVRYHKPSYFDDKRQLEKISDIVENWTGMKEGEEFNEMSRKFKSISFKTKDGRVIPLCTFTNGEPADLHHILSKKVSYNDPYTPDYRDESIDENFVLYRRNIGLSTTTAEKVTKYGPTNPFDYLSEDIIQILATMGYHRKNTTVDNRVFEVIAENIMVENKGSVDGGITIDTGKKSQGSSSTNENEESLAYTNVSSSILLSFVMILFTILLL